MCILMWRALLNVAVLVTNVRILPAKNICKNNQSILFCFQANKIWRPKKDWICLKINDVLANKTKTVVESILKRGKWVSLYNYANVIKRIKTCRGWIEYVFCVPHLFTLPPLEKVSKGSLSWILDENIHSQNRWKILAQKWDNNHNTFLWLIIW